MSPDSATSLRVLLGFLKAGRVLDRCSSVLLLGTLVFVLLPAAAGPLLLVVGLGLALGLLEKYFAWRVVLDAEFFALLLEQPQQADTFDAVLAAFLRRAAPAGGRSCASRQAGARRLVIRQALTLLAQVLVLLGLLLSRGLG